MWRPQHTWAGRRPGSSSGWRGANFDKAMSQLWYPRAKLCPLLPIGLRAVAGIHDSSAGVAGIVKASLDRRRMVVMILVLMDCWRLVERRCGSRVVVRWLGWLLALSALAAPA